MKNNVLFLLTLVLTISLSSYAQRGVRVAYIDSEYILENVPEYQEATNQLDNKAQKWKSEIEKKLAIIKQQRNDLSNEKALLTKELITEREEDITFEEQNILDYQQKRFGPNGDLFIQKKQLMQPVQDQIFSAVQDLAKARKYDFIFDKSSGTIMLFSAKHLDVSDQILRSITRAHKRNQAQSKAEKKDAKNEKLVPEINEELDARKKSLEQKKADRKKAIEKIREEKLAEREARKLAAKARKNNTINENEKTNNNPLKEKNSETTEEDETKTRTQLIEENRLRKLAEREARRKALEEKKQKILEDRKQNN